MAWCAAGQQTAAAATPSKQYANEHIIYGFPGTQGKILYRKGYVLDYNPATKDAVWASYHLTDTYLVANTPRSNDFRPDPDLPVGQRAELSDYRKSGYDRGHLVPAEDMRRGPQTESETFLLSNMTPQVGEGFNRGIWEKLESKVRLWAKQRKNIYVIDGPIFTGANHKTIGANHVAVPDKFYKIVVSCTEKGDNIDAIAFIFPNQKIAGTPLTAFITTIDEIENETGLDFLKDLDKQIQARVEAQKARMW